MTQKDSICVRGILPGNTAASDVELCAGKIARIGHAGRSAPDFGSASTLIGPTLFDTQVNGVAGYGLLGNNATAENVLHITEYLATWGVSHWIPTLVTAPFEEMEQGCRVIAEAMHDKRVARAVPGVHLEGPCISPEDGPRGAHPRDHVRPPKIAHFDRLMKAAEGKILYVTLAPEAPGAISCIRALVKRGIIVSLGHHGGTAEQITKAVDAGARLCTHLGNGAASQMHRHLNPLWPQLAEDRLMAGLIADLHHLPEPVLKTFVRAKGPERIILVSDCVRIAGLKPGKYHEFNADVELKPSGKLCLCGTDLLAGSAMMLLEGVVNAWRVTDLTLEQAFACATTIPAKFFGVKLAPASPALGRRADFVAFDVDGQAPRSKPKVAAVFINGERIEEAKRSP